MDIRILSDRTVTARKAHRCTVTKKVINAGEKYRRITQIWEGEIQTLTIKHR